MATRGKRSNHRLENEYPQPPTKRRKGRPPNLLNNENENEISPPNSNLGVSSVNSHASVLSSLQQPVPSSSSIAPWQPKSIVDIKISSIYNRSSSEAPAELFRKDLISAMKLPDSEPLASDDYWIITDQWKQEWEKGVQVPVNPDSLPVPNVMVLQHPVVQPQYDFKLPKTRFLRITKDESFSTELHYLSNVIELSESACTYDLDQVDEVWLKILNRERVLCGVVPITEVQFERIIEELEVRCWEKIQIIMKSDECLGIEYDENVICDVCRSPDSEEANEMVFCDNCNICVHQACYGITAIPSGQWLCRTCSVAKKPECVLCPNKGGAMKSTKSGKKWAHVSCALWIPEVSIGCVDRMEPITKISSIPHSRWALVCVLCREKVGACIQCSVKTCKTAYHVTCAFQHGLEMRAIIEEGNAEDGVKLRSYCLKHSVSKGKKDVKCTNNNGISCGGEEEDGRRRKNRKDMTTEERNQVRAQRLQDVEEEFHKHVNIRDISCHLLEVDQDAIVSIYNYWILKRKSRQNRALIPPKSDCVEKIGSKQEEADMEKRKMVVHLRQDLERARNLCYMVNRREKLSRSIIKIVEQIFHKQVAVLSDNNCKKRSEDFLNTVINANCGPSIYDSFYSISPSKQSTVTLSSIQDVLLGDINKRIKKNIQQTSCFQRKTKAVNKKHSLNGNISKDRSDKKKDSLNDQLSWGSSSDDSDDQHLSSLKGNKKQPFAYSMKNKNLCSLMKTPTSSEDDLVSADDKLNEDLLHISKEFKKDMDSSSNESDIINLTYGNKKSLNKKAFSTIYSDSESTSEDKDPNGSNASDSRKQKFRTKAAKKEFSLQQLHQPKKLQKNEDKKGVKTNHNNIVNSTSSKSIESRESSSKKHVSNEISDTKHSSLLRDNISKTSDTNMFSGDLLVVPQRQAAKKASENMRCTNSHVTAIAQKKDSKDQKDYRLEQKECNQISTINDKITENRETNINNAGEKDTEKKVKIRKETERDKEKAKERIKPRGRPPKQSKDEISPKQSKDCISPKQSKEDVSPKTSKDEISPKPSKDDASQKLKLIKKPLKSKSINTVSSDNSLINPIMAYVPQRQAAKKAAEHIKSGLGKPITSETTVPGVDDAKESIAKEKDKCISTKGFQLPTEKKSNEIKSQKHLNDAVNEDNEKPESSVIVENQGKTKSEIPIINNTSSSSESSSSSSSTSGTSSDDSDADEDINKKSKTINVSETEKEIETLPDPMITLKDTPCSSVKEGIIVDTSQQFAENLVTSKTLESSTIEDENNSGLSEHFDSTLYPIINKHTDHMEEEEVYPLKPLNKINSVENLISEYKADEETILINSNASDDMISQIELDDEASLNKSNKDEETELRTDDNLKDTNMSRDDDEVVTYATNTYVESENTDAKMEEDFDDDQNKLSDPKYCNTADLRPEHKSSPIISEICNIDMSPTPVNSATPPPTPSAAVLQNSDSLEIIALEHKLQQGTNMYDDKNNINGSKSIDFIPNDKETKITMDTYDDDESKRIAMKPIDIDNPPPTPMVDSIFDLIGNDRFVRKDQDSGDSLNANFIGNEIPSLKFLDTSTRAEDSVRATMNLVEKLRLQKLKRGEQRIEDINSTEEHKVPSNSFDLLQQKEFIPKTTVTTDSDKYNISQNDDRDMDNLVTLLDKKDSVSLNNMSVPFSDNLINFLDKEMDIISTSVKQPTLETCDVQKNLTKQSLSHGTSTINSTLESSQKDSNFTKLNLGGQQHSNKEMFELKSSKLDNDCDDSIITQSAYVQHGPNMWNENDLIQTRRSVSTSPSSISESIDGNKTINVVSNLAGSTSKALDENSNTSLLEQPYLQEPPATSNVLCANIIKSYLHDIDPFTHLSQTSLQNTAGSVEPDGMLNGSDLMESFSSCAESRQCNGEANTFHSHSSDQNLSKLTFPSSADERFTNSCLNAPPLAIPPQADSLTQNQSLHNTYENNLTKGQNINIPNQSNQIDLIGSSSRYLPIIPPNHQQACAVNEGTSTFTRPLYNLSMSSHAIPSNHINRPLQLQTPSDYSVPNPEMILPQTSGLENSSQYNSLLLMSDVGQNNNMSRKEPQIKRFSSRVNHNIKGSHIDKSPSKSSQQMELLNKSIASTGACGKLVKNENSRQRSRAVRGVTNNRVRGRGRGRGRNSAVSNSSTIQIQNAFDQHLGSIHNNLRGTVYDLDFEEDFDNVENLKSLRDRRKSFDCRINTHGQTPEQTISSPPYDGCKIRKISNDSCHISSLKRPCDNAPRLEHGEPSMPNAVILDNIVSPVLPGPVDMRTYNSSFEAQHSTSSQEAYNSNLLGAFDSGIADQTLHDIDEEDEKNFQSALKASGTGIQQNPPPNAQKDIVMPAELHVSMETTSEEISIDSDTTNTKASLSDSRSQLKFKIKGPLAYPDNCNNSSVKSVNQNVLNQRVNIQASVNVQVSNNPNTGTSSIRRMRKKELLRQYWSNDMNQDDTGGHHSNETKTNLDQNIGQTTGISNSTDSILLLPVPNELKKNNTADITKRKKTCTRELRQLEPTSYEENPRLERKRSSCSSGSNDNAKSNRKRRERSKTHEVEEESIQTLKITIRNNSVETTPSVATNESSHRLVGCPPKKRPNYVIPSLETLKRDSMNFRKQVMANFKDDDEEKPSSITKTKLRSGKEHKRKKKAKYENVTVSDQSSSGAPKIILRIGKRLPTEESTHDKPSSNTIAPIKLKIARKSDGGAYVIGKKRKTPKHHHTQSNGADTNTMLTDTKNSKNCDTDKEITNVLENNLRTEPTTIINEDNCPNLSTKDSEMGSKSTELNELLPQVQDCKILPKKDCEVR